MSTVTMSGILVKSTDLPRVPLAEGIDYRMVRTSSETETWTILLRASVRSPYAMHRYLGQGKVFLVKGVWSIVPFPPSWANMVTSN